MKSKLNQAILAAILLTEISAAHAQQTPALPPPPKPGDHGPRKPGAPGEKPGAPGLPNKQLVQLAIVSGTVDKAISNDRFEYNGFVLNTGSGSITVTYPPHLGEKIYNLAKSGTSAKVTGFYRTSPLGTKEFHLVTLAINGTEITDTPPTPPTVAAAQQQTSLNATIKELIYTPAKEVNGFILSSGEMIGVPPHIALQLATQLKPGEKIGVTGFIEPKRQGVVYSQKLVQIKAQTLTLNGQAYLVM